MGDMLRDNRRLLLFIIFSNFLSRAPFLFGVAVVLAGLVLAQRIRITQELAPAASEPT